MAARFHPLSRLSSSGKFTPKRRLSYSCRRRPGEQLIADQRDGQLIADQRDGQRLFCVQTRHFKEILMAQLLLPTRRSFLSAMSVTAGSTAVAVNGRAAKLGTSAHQLGDNSKILSTFSDLHWAVSTAIDNGNLPCFISSAISI
jgi:hypothetical protein